MESEGCHSLWVRAQLDLDVDKPRKKALVSTPQLPAGPGLEGELEKLALLRWKQLEAGARPAPLPVPLVLFFKWLLPELACLGKGSGNREPFSKQGFKGPLSCAQSPLFRAAANSSLSVLGFTPYLGHGQHRGPSSGRLCGSPVPYLRWFLSLK